MVLNGLHWLPPAWLLLGNGIREASRNICMRISGTVPMLGFRCQEFQVLAYPSWLGSAYASVPFWFLIVREEGG